MCPRMCDTSSVRAPLAAALRAFQRRYIQECLEANGWNVAATARQLDLARSHVYNLMTGQRGTNDR